MAGEESRGVAAPALELRIGLLPLPDFTLLALTGFLEALRIAGDDADRSRNLYCRWDIMSPNSGYLRSSCGLSVSPTSKLQPPESFDYIVVVGGRLEAHERTDPAIIEYVQRASARRVPLIGACTGSFLLARAGLMDGYRACVHQFHLTEFQSEFPDIAVESNRLFVIDGPRITCPGGASAFDLAIHLIQRHCGRDRALKTVYQLLFDEARSSSHPQSLTAVDISAPARDPMVRRAVLIMQQTIGASLPIQAVADQLGTNVKRLSRAFQAHLGTSPGGTYRQIRLERALWLVEHSARSMSEIAYECGFADASHFSRTFRSAFGVRPSDIRAKLMPQPGMQRPSAGSYIGHVQPN